MPAANRLTKRINEFLDREAWDEARELLQREREREPENHWVLTQLGVTFYEQRRYEEAMELFQESWKIVPDCPLTLWNLAGTLDALGKPAEAVKQYTWLLQNSKSPGEDPCWESQEWTDSLLADCIYRLGICLGRQGKPQLAEGHFRQYINLLLAGINGAYPIEDAMCQIRKLHGNGAHRAAERKKAIHVALQASGGGRPNAQRKSVPQDAFVKPGRRAAAKK